MNDTQSDDDVIRMPVRWWSIQWLSIRILLALVAGGLVTQKADSDVTAVSNVQKQATWALVSGLVVAAIVFGILTAIAISDRRRWAREHSEDQPEL